jgi:hypothetical protein
MHTEKPMSKNMGFLCAKAMREKGSGDAICWKMGVPLESK